METDLNSGFYNMPKGRQQDNIKSDIKLSIVIPCLNESLTIGKCIKMAQSFFERAGIRGEVIVADNGSTDDSIAISEFYDAKVVRVDRQGYGAAIMGGIQAASGTYVVMGDADLSYDFSQLDLFYEKLEQGFDLVMGNRFAGGIASGAMPFLHRYLGNPILSGIGRLFFGGNCRDFHCGLRGFRRTSILSLDLNTTGMEFASEMLVKANLQKNLRITEVPTKLEKDGRDRKPHLRTWRDGWRHLKFLLLHSPRWLLLYPGLTLMTLGLLLSGAIILSPLAIGSAIFDVHTLLYAVVLSILGLQTVLLGIYSRKAGANLGFLPKLHMLDNILAQISLEKGLITGFLLITAGIGLSAYETIMWGGTGFGKLNPQSTLRVVIPAIGLIMAGAQFIMASLFLNFLQLSQPQMKKLTKEGAQK